MSGRTSGLGALSVAATVFLGTAHTCLAAQPADADVAGDEQPSDVAELAAGPHEGRPITAIRVDGLSRVKPTLVQNNMVTHEGMPLDSDILRQDLRRLERLGEFREIRADVELNDDQSVTVVLTVKEAPIVRDIAVVGNTQISDQEISKVVGEMVSLIAGVPVDDFRIGRAQRAVEDLYRSKGFYFAQVSVDETELETNGIVTFRVREGERVKVTAIRFEGNRTYSSKRLRPELKTKTVDIFESGPLDDKSLEDDVSTLTKYYRDRGYLDARVARTITPSPNGREAIVTFVIDEGPLYTLRTVIVRGTGNGTDNADSDNGDAPGTGLNADGLRVMNADQIRALMEPKPGDAYGARPIELAVQAIKDAYGQMGYIDAKVTREELRDETLPQVDLRLTITEGRRFRVGMVEVQGNDLTQSKVVRRDLQFRPGRWVDTKAIKESKQELDYSRLFGRNQLTGEGVKITPQPESPQHPGERDVLVEVEETNTGSFSFGAGVNSDLGVFGVIELTQRNFDIADTPDSLEELFRGRAFRGAGQTFRIALQPGIESSVYSIALTEPSLFESEYGLGVDGFFRDRDYDEYDEQRIGGRFRLGRTFGTRWSGGVSFRAENVDITDIDRGSAVDLYDVQGSNLLTSIGIDMTRSTVDNRIRPTRGTRTEFTLDQYGALGGDYSFTKFAAEHNLFVTVNESELGYKTVLSFKGRVGYMLPEDEAPVFERFYLGGRSFRGFDFRGIGPLGIKKNTGRIGNDRVGGDFMFFAGTELEQPVFRDVVSVVGFVDSGTVNDDFGFEDYRVSVGIGLRLYVPQFSAAPFAFDFGFPILKSESDQEEVFSFSIDIPF